MFEDDVQLADEVCPKCGRYTVTRSCTAFDCEDGWRDLYDDDPLYYDPGDMERCSECNGQGYHHWCQHCGWDLLEKRYVNGLARVFFPSNVTKEMVDAYCKAHAPHAANFNDREAILF